MKTEVSKYTVVRRRGCPVGNLETRVFGTIGAIYDCKNCIHSTADNPTGPEVELSYGGKYGTGWERTWVESEYITVTDPAKPASFSERLPGEKHYHYFYAPGSGWDVDFKSI